MVPGLGCVQADTGVTIACNPLIARGVAAETPQLPEAAPAQADKGVPVHDGTATALLAQILVTLQQIEAAQHPTEVAK